MELGKRVTIRLTIHELAHICDALHWSWAKNERLYHWTKKNPAAKQGHFLRWREAYTLWYRLNELLKR